MALADMTFMDDGNPQKLPNGLINWTKCRGYAKMIHDMLEYQDTAYGFETVPLFQEKLIRGVGKDEGELFQLSLIREPRTKQAAAGSSSGASSNRNASSSTSL